MLDGIVSSSCQKVMEKALGAASLRNQVISNNIANVNTPGFKRSDVQFEGVLAQALDNKSKLTLAATNNHHLSGSGGNELAPTIATSTETSMRVDGNNVDIDTEMADIAKNTIYYNAVAHQLGRYFSNLKSVIKEGK
ncbi:MAG: flagellar basal-body rod protein FlgB [Firmicutes bacterium]|nr:flagellar basal-body rod protein FlgB [Bacillota bacterium]